METTAPQLQGEHMRDTIDMAREAGFVLRAESVKGQSDWWECFDEAIEKLVALARDDERDRAMRENAYVQAEREACAKVLDEMAEDMEREMEPSTAIAYVRSKAATIRARGETK
jgi:hypothetical protein